MKPEFRIGLGIGLGAQTPLVCNPICKLFRASRADRGFGRLHAGMLAGLASALLAACGGGDVAEDLRREPLAVTATAETAATAYDPDDLYRFFAIAFGAAPGVTYMGQLLDAANAGMSIKAIVNVFTTKPQFLETYPTTLTNQEYAQKLVDNVVGTSATAAAKAEAVADIVAALSLPNWTRGDITYAIFNNLAKKPADDVKWAATAKKMANQVAYAKHFTEAMKVDTTDLVQLRGVVKTVTESSPVSGADLGALIQAAVQAALAQNRNRAPLARAMADRPAVQAGAPVLLNGRTSFDFEGKPITYAWKLDSLPQGSSAALSSTTADQTTFVADLPGQYVATLVVNDGASNSKPAKVTVTALPAGALTAGQAVVASLNTGVCAGFTGCAPSVLADFSLTFNQCTITKVGPSVTVARPGMDPISAEFDGDVVDRASLSGNSLVIALRGKVVTDQLNVTIHKDTGAVTSATGTATADGVTRSIDCKNVSTGIFPTMAAVPSVTSLADLLKALDPSDCKGVADGVGFSSCGTTVAPDFSLKVGVCTLTKTGDTLSVSKATGAPVSARLNGELTDGVGEAFDAGGNSVRYVGLQAYDLDAAAGSQQLISVRVIPSNMTAIISASDSRKGSFNVITC